MEESGAFTAVIWCAHFLGVATTIVLFGVSLFPFYTGVRGWPPIWSRLAPPFLSLILIVALVSNAGLTLIDLTGSAGSLLSADELDAFFFQTNFGPVWLAAIVASAVLFAVALSFALPAHLPEFRYRQRDAILLLLTAAILAGFAATGHAASAGDGAARGAIASETLHLLAAAAWLGGLPPLLAYIVGLEHDRRLPAASPVLGGFSFMGQWAVAMLVIGGISTLAILAAFWRVSLSGLQPSPYELALCLKFILLLILLSIAGVNRFVLIPALKHGPRVVKQLRIMVVAECVFGALVVGTATILSRLAPPF